MKILYTGAFRFPDGDAAAFRVKTIADMIRQNGYEVVFAGWEDMYLGATSYIYDKYKCHSQNEFRLEKRNILKRLILFFLTGKHTLRYFFNKHDYNVVVLYNPPFLFTLIMLIMCKFYKIKLVLDSTEWYDSKHLPGGKFGPASLEQVLRMYLIYPRIKNVICISKFLENYFGAENKIRIPPLIDQDFSFNSNDLKLTKDIRFIYAGTPGNKDKVVDFIKILPDLELAIKKKIIFNVAGVNSISDIFESEYEIQKYGKILKCHGYLTRENVFKLYRDSHFSVLFREEARYAYAGFPTKAMESWAHGCPIITNAVGDLKRIANNKENAIIVEVDNMLENLTVTIRDIFANPESYLQMRVASLDTAKKYFLGDIYINEFKQFLVNLS